MVEEPNLLRRRLVLGGIAATPVAGAFASAAGSGEPNGLARAIEIDARPSPIAVSLNTAAVLVIDMQNDFGSKGGMFDLAGIDISGIQRAVAPTAQTLDAARRAGMKIIYLKMGFAPDLSDLGAANSVNRTRHQRLNVGKSVRAPNGDESRILVRDTWNTAIVDALKPEAGDISIWKTRFSGFYKTELDATLRSLGVQHLIVTGCTTSICVEATVRDAMFRDYLCVLLSDCMSEPIGEGLARSNHDASLLSVEVLLGWVSTSASFIGALSA